MAEVDLIDWIVDALERKPHLNRKGLALHLGKDPAWSTLVLGRRRALKAVELAKVEQYLGELHPRATSGFVPLPIVGRIGRGWYDPSDMPRSDLKVAPVLSFADGAQVAYLVEDGYPRLPPGSVIVASPITARSKVNRGAAIVEQHERAGLINLRLGRYLGPVSGLGTAVAVVIEARIPPTDPHLFLTRPAAHRRPEA